MVMEVEEALGAEAGAEEDVAGSVAAAAVKGLEECGQKLRSPSSQHILSRMGECKQQSHTSNLQWLLQTGRWSLLAK